jgi:PAS domain S-box-containing protein
MSVSREPSPHETDFALETSTSTVTSDLRALPSGAGSIVPDALLGNAPSTLVIADADRTILRVGPSCFELSGWEDRELEGLTLSQYHATFKPSDPVGRRIREDELPLSRALNGERITAHEGSIAHRSGERVPVAVNAAPLARPDGRVIGSTSALTNLRRYKDLERALHDTERELLALHGELAQRIGKG